MSYGIRTWPEPQAKRWLAGCNSSGRKDSTFEQKPFSVYDENTARIQTGRQSYIYLPTRAIDTSLPTRNAGAPRGRPSARRERLSRHRPATGDSGHRWVDTGGVRGTHCDLEPTGRHA